MVYAWLMAGVGPDPEARRDLDVRIYAPAEGLEQINSQVWAAIMSSEDDD